MLLRSGGGMQRCQRAAAHCTQTQRSMPCHRHPHTAAGSAREQQHWQMQVRWRTASEQEHRTWQMQVRWRPTRYARKARALRPCRACMHMCTYSHTCVHLYRARSQAAQRQARHLPRSSLAARPVPPAFATAQTSKRLSEAAKERAARGASVHQ